MTSVPPSQSGTVVREPTVVTTLRSLDELVRRPACLVVIHGENIGHKYDLDVKALTIGRGRDNDICVNHRSVSRNHVEIAVDDRGVQLRDLRSTNGTYVNDQPVGNVYLRDGDRIKVGRTVFKFISGSNVEAAYHDQLFTMTRYDALTGVFNRRSFDEKVQDEFARAERYGRPLALILFDIDHFKRCNDTWGHRAGDHVLREVAQLVQRRARKHDFVARYGGEEFAVILHEFEQPGPQTFAEEIRALVQDHEFEFEGNRIPVTVSLGLVIWESGYETVGQLIEAADQCLYLAKQGGRNRVVSAQEG
ncbi:diguanylate cyclase [Pseudenhygromyxa sp. WMMC2535]|uniref:diguanylate cyclase n=1 Tax=Pseudenhygromyxa sp. WMMC2535 TaxID=2712867 RepID=UPI0015558CE0|nr:GGDEF domain-containing protein [Pseudenhygromyxa sp. WMMC2535]NVB42154.1 diguanylate cyclase [Pseudenhygromyxa sp. WMMC2535]